MNKWICSLLKYIPILSSKLHKAVSPGSHTRNSAASEDPYKIPDFTKSYLREYQIHAFVVWWTETTVSGAEDSMETSEAAAALLNMESPNNILDEKRMSKLFSIALFMFEAGHILWLIFFF